MNDEESKQILREILKWQRLQGFKTLKELMPSLLDNDKKKIVYEMTDGKITQSEIIKKIHMSSATITDWWKEWHAYGIIIQEGKKYQKIISLEKLGIEIPTLDQEND